MKRDRLEQIARAVCAKRMVDPDMVIMHPFPVIRTGTARETMTGYLPVWEVVAREISDVIDIIDVVKELAEREEIA